MMLGRIVRIRHRPGASAILRRPLVRTRRTLCQFPLVAEQIFEIVVAPLRRRRGPNHFQAAADRLSAAALAEAILPAEALLFDSGAFGLSADIFLRIGS